MTELIFYLIHYFLFWHLFDNAYNSRLLLFLIDSRQYLHCYAFEVAVQNIIVLFSAIRHLNDLIHKLVFNIDLRVRILAFLEVSFL